ncbi:hypothetical protein TNCV_3918891 [Trichonephila clavipes]|nr:hypothetical protein TNCV_3918891 [Trichonephila clavipes]
MTSIQVSRLRVALVENLHQSVKLMSIIWFCRMLAKNAFTEMKSPQLAEVGLREGGFSFPGQPLCTIVGNSGRGMILPQQDGWPRGIIEREDHRIRRTAVAHRSASGVEIRAAVGTTVTQRTVASRTAPS